MSRTSVSRFGDIRGHEQACARLRAAVADDRLPQSLVLTGPEGVGKRCVALALAAWRLCDARGDDACGSCPSCRQIAAGSHPDHLLVTVAPGKKEIGVERAREIKHFAQLQPVRGGAKAVIVDDAHLLTVAAQNALLKTLEEPPDHSLLVLVVNNPDALLATVRSRCQRVQFAPLPSATVVEILVAQHAVPPDTAAALAALASGSPGRALEIRRCFDDGSGGQLLEQLAAPTEARYVSLARLANELSHPEDQLALKLEVLLSRLRDAIVRETDMRTPGTEMRTMLRRADAVHAAWAAVRQRNPNRQMLLEALLLRLARA